ncbi:MAG TPA: M23 family metallopeptidase [Candidatus Acidoferrales bacterium]|nr:M23 family metallopeptidase [Candidatus Acidoferrales bacterium]
MRRKYYTFFIASTDSGNMRRMRIPHYALHLLVALALVGSATVLVAVGTYSRTLWKAKAYNSLLSDQHALTQQYHELQTQVKDANERLNSLQSLASEVAVAYGLTGVSDTPFSLTNTSQESDATYKDTVDQFNFLQQNSEAVMLASTGSVRLTPGLKLLNAPFIPSLWPVMGRITSRFGERLDPFGGEGEFHTGLDIASHYGDDVRAAADGVVVWTGNREGYGRVVIIDHGFGITTWYAHLSSYDTEAGMRVKRGDVIAQEGDSGRATASHLHFEVRINNAPVNPWPYLHQADVGGTVAAGGD